MIADEEADACRCPQCGAAPCLTNTQWYANTVAQRPAMEAAETKFFAEMRGRSTLEILADHWPPVLRVSGPSGSVIAEFVNPSCTCATCDVCKCERPRVGLW